MQCGKRVRGDWCASSHLSGKVTATSDIPIIMVKVGGRSFRALVDTGCTNSMIRGSHGEVVSGCTSVSAFDGSQVQCRGTVRVTCDVRGRELVIDMIVVETLIKGIDIVLGLDVINELGGVHIHGMAVKFGSESVCAIGQQVGTDQLYDGKLSKNIAV